MVQRPLTNEYMSYYSRYVEQIPDGDIIEILGQQLEAVLTFMAVEVDENNSCFRYEEGKWSIKEVLGHVVDTERIMCFRILSFARGEKVPLPGFNENEYVARAEFDRQSLKELLESFSITRILTINLLKSLKPEAWLSSGIANESSFTVRALAFIIAGHEKHHMHIIRERYLRKNSYS